MYTHRYVYILRVIVYTGYVYLGYIYILCVMYICIFVGMCTLGVYIGYVYIGHVYIICVHVNMYIHRYVYIVYSCRVCIHRVCIHTMCKCSHVYT